MSAKVLIVSKVCTHPVVMGNSKAILAQANILRELGCDIDFLFIHEVGLSRKQKESSVKIYADMNQYWGENLFYMRIGKIEKLCKNLLSLYRMTIGKGHEGTYDKYPWHLTSYVSHLQSKEKYDICLVQYYYLTKLYKSIKFKKMACFTHDAMAYKNLVVNDNCAWIDAGQEAKALQLCTDVFAIQDVERDYFSILSPQSRIYNIYTPYAYTPTPLVGNRNIVFLSGDNGFNQNGLKWFVNEVLPLIRTKYQEAKLIVAGGICKVLKGKYENVAGVELIGYVDDPKNLYAMGDVAINPVYQGTGLKIKTFEAISYDKVTLVHPHSMAGVFKKDDAPLFASDKPEEWLSFLDSVWGNEENIKQIKSQNEKYLAEMNVFIVNEYKRFLEI